MNEITDQLVGMNNHWLHLINCHKKAKKRNYSISLCVYIEACAHGYEDTDSSIIRTCNFFEPFSRVSKKT